ncbi:MAG: HEAT repeat domain-containing protein [Gemmataceae bacterium]
MLRKRRFWLIAVLILLTTFGLVAAFEPNRVVPGLLHGEAFYRYRPTRYWREVLRADGEAGRLSSQTIALFDKQWRAQAVLRQCLKDPDPHVRWPAARYLGSSKSSTAEIVPDLLAALDDEDLEVRLKVLWALGEIGPNAFAAGPRLVEMLKDPDEQFAYFVEVALWMIDPRRAREECSWKEHSSKEWQFSAIFPPGVEEKTGETVTPNGPVPIQSWIAARGPCAYAVAVSEYTEEQLKGITPQIWFERMRKQQGLAGLHVVLDKDIEINGRPGREHLLEADDRGRILARLFWVGRRLYQVTVTFKPQYYSPGATRFFLDSFHIEPSQK